MLKGRWALNDASGAGEPGDASAGVVLVWAWAARRDALGSLASWTDPFA